MSATPPTPTDGMVEKPNKAVNSGDTESIVSEQTLIAQREGIKPAFLAKVSLLNEALSEIGMGRYQYELFVSGGFGWFADNICEWRSARRHRQCSLHPPLPRPPAPCPSPHVHTTWVASAN